MQFMTIEYISFVNEFYAEKQSFFSVTYFVNS